jgi:hypothetical protein
MAWLPLWTFGIFEFVDAFGRVRTRPQIHGIYRTWTWTEVQVHSFLWTLDRTSVRFSVRPASGAVQDRTFPALLGTRPRREEKSVVESWNDEAGNGDRSGQDQGAAREACLQPSSKKILRVLIKWIPPLKYERG